MRENQFLFLMYEAPPFKEQVRANPWGSKYQHSDSTQPASSTHGGSSVLRPLPNSNRRSQQVIGPQKGPSKEWKPKPANPNLTQGSRIDGSTEVPTATEITIQSNPVLSVLDSKEATSKLQRKLICGTFLIVC
ncbi:uncharacterized protein LOC131326239 isoform X2 [Rhododendron vialii]|uniref:uncharacterized protein LOC131326239 isoform X2 n=1 Tax=Rhododendron vialii TaxID=182163 RepID=UPI00266021DC|nr:uncharacterized protein LOC131326239 isoform X2 [Rhododendron vialii]